MRYGPRFAFSLAHALCLFLVACQSANNPNPCPQGICIGGGGEGGPLTDAAVGPCVEAWACTQWATAANGQYTRMCSDNNRCGTTGSKPNEGPVPLPNLDLDFYQCKVEPIFDRGCAMMGCHGTAAADNTRPFRLFARGRRRNRQTVPARCLDSGPQSLDKGSGTIMCYGWTAHTSEEWQQNYDSARALLVGLSNPDDCDLLLQPVAGGKAHSGVHLFAGKSDVDYQTIRAWLSGAKLGSTCNPMN